MPCSDTPSTQEKENLPILNLLRLLPIKSGFSTAKTWKYKGCLKAALLFCKLCFYWTVECCIILYNNNYWRVCDEKDSFCRIRRCSIHKDRRAGWCSGFSSQVYRQAVFWREGHSPQIYLYVTGDEGQDELCHSFLYGFPLEKWVCRHYVCRGGRR